MDRLDGDEQIGKETVHIYMLYKIMVDRWTDRWMDG